MGEINAATERFIKAIDKKPDNNVQKWEVFDSLNEYNGVNGKLEVGEFRDWIKAVTGCSEAESQIAAKNLGAISKVRDPDQVQDTEYLVWAEWAGGQRSIASEIYKKLGLTENSDDANASISRDQVMHFLTKIFSNTNY